MRFFDFDKDIKKDTQFVIFGIPWDYLTSIDLPNSSIAPEKIRNVTNDIGWTTELGDHITKFKVVDVGDVIIERVNVEKNLKTIKNFLENIYKKNEGIIPIMIGGDHFCSYPVIKSVGDNFRKKEEFGVLIFDAHLDFYQEWEQGVYSHATISHRIFDFDYIDNKNLLVVGTRDIDIPELEIAESENIEYFSAYQLIEGLDNYIIKIKNFFKKSNIKYLYVSIDIDALDPSIAPGTGFAIPGGFSYRELWKILKEISENFEIIGFDLVEVAPNLDLKNKMTCNLAAKLLIELISFVSNKK
ncbi:MAG: arginase family protein [Candidatus Lokiarchaeota archaeon]|nr:arginase family protein [Candidatus Lokiarchaeota archaeon]